MERKIARKSLEVKMGGQAIECGTVEILLSLLVAPSPILLFPLVLTLPQGGQSIQQYLVHVTARPAASSPILYATVHAAYTVGLAESWTLFYPYRGASGNEAATRAEQLQQELLGCLQQFVRPHPCVSAVVCPARYRLPDEWVRSVHSHSPRIICQEKHWVLAEEVAHHGC